MRHRQPPYHWWLLQQRQELEIDPMEKGYHHRRHRCRQSSPWHHRCLHHWTLRLVRVHRESHRSLEDVHSDWILTDRGFAPSASPQHLVIRERDHQGRGFPPWQKKIPRRYSFPTDVASRLFVVRRRRSLFRLYLFLAPVRQTVIRCQQSRCMHLPDRPGCLPTTPGRALLGKDFLHRQCWRWCCRCCRCRWCCWRCRRRRQCGCRCFCRRCDLFGAHGCWCCCDPASQFRCLARLDFVWIVSRPTRKRFRHPHIFQS